MQPDLIKKPVITARNHIIKIRRKQLAKLCPKGRDKVSKVYSNLSYNGRKGMILHNSKTYRISYFNLI
jgi:hypothetical protein